MRWQRAPPDNSPATMSKRRSFQQSQNISVTRLKFTKAAKQHRHKGQHMFKPVRLGAQDDDGKRQIPDFILLRQIFVHRDKQVELAGGGDLAEQFAVADAGPAGLWHGFDGMAGECARQILGQTFVEQEAHQAGWRDFSSRAADSSRYRSEEHTSELQSLRHLVCRLLLEKKT